MLNMRRGSGEYLKFPVAKEAYDSIIDAGYEAVVGNEDSPMIVKDADTLYGVYSAMEYLYEQTRINSGHDLPTLLDIGKSISKLRQIGQAKFGLDLN